MMRMTIAGLALALLCAQGLARADEAVYRQAVAWLTDAEPKNDNIALQLMMREAQAENRDAMAWLPYAFDRGLGVPRDTAKAAEFEAILIELADGDITVAYRSLDRGDALAWAQGRIVEDGARMVEQMSRTAPPPAPAPAPPPPAPPPAPLPPAPPPPPAPIVGFEVLQARAARGDAGSAVELAGRFQSGKVDVARSDLLCLFWAATQPADARAQRLAQACRPGMGAEAAKVELAAARWRRKPAPAAPPQDKDAAVLDFLAWATPEEMRELRNTPRAGLRAAHEMAWGLAASYRYRLVADNAALLRAACGGAECPAHVASMVIVEAAWDASWKAIAKGFGAIAAVTAAPADTPERRAELARPVDEFLRRLDAGSAGLTWNEASPLLQARVDRGAWVGRMMSARGPLHRRTVRSRVTLGQAFSGALRGHPPGEYATVDVETDFDGRLGDERVTLHRHDGRWKIVDYVAVPRD